MKQKLEIFARWFKGMCRKLPQLLKTTASMTLGSLETALVCLLLLAALCMLNTAQVVRSWHSEVGLLLQLSGSIIIMPVAACMMTYAVGACWERRRVSLIDAAHLVRIRIRELLLTALAVGAVGMGVNWLGTLLSSLIEGLALLTWIPVFGHIVAGSIAATLWLIALAMEYVVHVVLTAGMAALTADGLSGRAQAARVLDVLRGGWKNMRDELTLIFGMWIAVRATFELLSYFGASFYTLLSWDVANALMIVISTAAVSVTYLQQRDCQDGTSYYA